MEDNITVRNLVKKTVQDADMVLVGIGEEFGIPSGKMEESAEYAVFMEQTNGAGQFQWMVPFLGEIHKENGRSDQVMAAYQVLGEMIRDKNYFVVSTRTDDFIYDAGLREDRIVTPCGGYRFWQCAQGCGQNVYGGTFGTGNQELFGWKREFCGSEAAALPGMRRTDGTQQHYGAGLRGGRLS